MPDKNLPSTSMATGEEGGGDPRNDGDRRGIAMFVAFDRATIGDLCHTMIQTLLTASGDAAATANE